MTLFNPSGHTRLLHGGGWGDVGGEVADEEFLDDVLDGCFAETDGGVFEDEARAGAVGGWVVGVRDGGGGETADEARVFRLPVVVVALADNCGGDGVKDARTDSAGAFVEVARILLEEDGQERVAEHVSGEEGAIVGGVAFAIALRALSPVVDIVGLLGSGGDSIHQKRHGVDQRSEGELILLFRSERHGFGDVADVEVGEDAEDALLLFHVDLGFGDVGLRRGDADVGGGGGAERDCGEVESFGGVEFAQCLLGREPCSGDGEPERAGRDAEEGETAVGGGDSDLGRVGGLDDERDAGCGDGVAVAVGDEAGDGTGEGFDLRCWSGRKLGGQAWMRARQEEEGQRDGTQHASRGEIHWLPL
jgi:hypothetical protein